MYFVAIFDLPHGWLKITANPGLRLVECAVTGIPIAVLLQGFSSGGAMKLFVVVLGFFLLSACVTRQVERETVVERPAPNTVVVPNQGTTRGSDTTIIVPQR
jgi:hypothetical protein